MIKQLLIIVEFPQLYNILFELQNSFAFSIINFYNSIDFLSTKNFDENKKNSSIIIDKKKKYLLLLRLKFNESLNKSFRKYAYSNFLT